MTYTTVAGMVADADAARRAWGETVSVPVVRRLIEAGEVIEGRAVERVRLPRRVVPDGAVAADPRGQAARVRLWPGEIVLAERLAPAGLQGVAALVPPGGRALAVPAGTGTPPLDVGDTVDVLATFDIAAGGHDDSGPGASGHGEGANATGEGAGAGGEDAAPLPAPTFAVAAGAVVLHIADETVTVAVPVEDAPRVAFALARGTVTLALAGA